MMTSVPILRKFSVDIVKLQALNDACICKTLLLTWRWCDMRLMDYVVGQCVAYQKISLMMWKQCETYAGRIDIWHD